LHGTPSCRFREEIPSRRKGPQAGACEGKAGEAPARAAEREERCAASSEKVR
jgi:hypothetical protein